MENDKTIRKKYHAKNGASYSIKIYSVKLLHIILDDTDGYQK